MNLTELQKRAKEIQIELYKNGLVQTIFNTEDEKHFDGWTLKNGMWSPWYFNLRPVGAFPSLVSNIAFTMNHFIRDNVTGLTQITGIEMAGVPLVSAIGTARGPGCELIPYSYTRALPGAVKPRKPEEAKKVLDEMGIAFGYGGKELVEGRFKDGENICILDDMVTDFGSKLIAKYILEYELKGRGVSNASINHVAVVLDREQGGEEEAIKQNMHLHPLIRFKTSGLNWLRDVMIPEEHELITNYQSDPHKYQIGPGQESNPLMEKAIEDARRYRATA